MKKILCFRNSKLGDYLISIPSLKLIREKYPNCKIYYLTVRSKNYVRLPKKINEITIVDEFIYFTNNFKNYLNLIKVLKSHKFEIFYYLNEKTNKVREIRDFIFFNLIGINYMHGFFKKKLNYSNNNETFQLAKRIDNNISKSKIFKLNRIKKNKKKPIYNSNYITISIGGFSQPKLWNIQNWSNLIDMIIKTKNCKILILGTKEDLRNSKILSSKNRKKIFSLCGKTSLNEIFNLIENSKLHITNDNGTMHIASLFSKKTICLFNNHDPFGKWHPSNKNAIIFRSNKGVNGINPFKVFKRLFNFI